MYGSLQLTTNDIFEQFYMSLKFFFIVLNGNDKRVELKGLNLFFDEITSLCMYFSFNKMWKMFVCLKTFNCRIFLIYIYTWFENEVKDFSIYSYLYKYAGKN